MATLAHTLELLNQGIDAGLHIGAQLIAMVDGQVVAEEEVGLARLAADSPGGADVPMTADTLMLWLSAGKPVTAVAVMMLWERGLVGLDEPVATYWPEFGQGGKEAITVRHLLTHTGGFRGVDTAYPHATWEETLNRIATMRIERDWVAGMKAGYHTHSSWYVLGEVIHRVTGLAVDAWIRRELLVPLGMHDTWLCMTPETYHAYGERIGYLYDTTVTPPSPPKPLMNYDTETAAGRARPSASCRGPMRELVRFYEMLRRGGELDGARVLNEQTVAAVTMRQRVGMFDQTFRQTIDWGLGVILNSSHYGPGIPYQFGPHASRETFGHGGSQSSTGFCDPRRNLVVAMVFNGCPGEAAHDKRLRAVVKSLYEELGLAG
jgi:CubicO group peptidase (beta-lactamase class C family)